MASTRWLPMPIKAALADWGTPKQPGDDSIHTTDSPLDFLPYTEMASMAAKGAGAAGRAALPSVEALLADETGGVKMRVPWARQSRNMQGQNPLDMTAQDLGKFVANHPSTRVKTGELMGAQAIDQYGTTNPTGIIHAHMAEEGLPPPRVIHEPGSIQGGSYNVGTGDIRLGQMSPAESLAYQDPEALHAGTALHEALHASHAAKNPIPADLAEHGGLGQLVHATSLSYPETLTSPESLKSNAGLSWEGFMQPHKVEAMLRYAKSDRGSSVKLPDYINNALSQGMSPKMVSQTWMQNPEQVSKWMGQNIREAVGNRGFRGTDPFLGDILQSTGHLPPYRGEMEIPVHRLGRLQAKAGGEIPENWTDQFPDLKQLQQEYKSPIRPGNNAAIEQSPWMPMAAGLGGTLAGALMRGDQSQDQLSQPAAHAEENGFDPETQKFLDQHRKSYRPGW